MVIFILLNKEDLSTIIIFYIDLSIIIKIFNLNPNNNKITKSINKISVYLQNNS
jgi:hypothetical protein